MKGKSDINVKNLSDEELKEFAEFLVVERDKMQKEWAEELASFATENFDPYSYWGERKLKKLALKYAKKMAGPNYLIELCTEEYARRDKITELDHYSSSLSRSNFTKKEEDFIKEQEKLTSVYRNKKY